MIIKINILMKSFQTLYFIDFFLKLLQSILGSGTWDLETAAKNALFTHGMFLT